MAVLFYDHLIDKQVIQVHLDEMDMDDDTRSRLKNMVDEILHHGILEKILQRLAPHRHKTFLTRLEQAPYDPELLVYLKEHAGEDIEVEIINEGKRIMKLILRKDLGIED